MLNDVQKDLDEHRLISAVKSGDIEAVEPLLLSGDDVNLVCNKRGLPLTPLGACSHIKSSIRMAKMALFLLSQGAEVYADTKRELGDLNEAYYQRNIGMMTILLQYGADPDSKSDGRRLLELVVMKSAYNVIELLLNYGAKVKFKDDTPLLHLAIEKKNPKIAILLIEHGFDVNEFYRMKPPMMHVVNTDKVSLAESLLNYGANPNAIYNLDNTSLLNYACRQNIDIVKLLISHGADFNHDSHYGTPLTNAIHHNNLDMIHELIKSGANIEFESAHDLTPLVCAIKCCRHQIVRDLIDQGADVTRKIQGKHDPLAIAKMNTNGEIVAMIENKMLQQSTSKNDITHQPTEDAALVMRKRNRI